MANQTEVWPRFKELETRRARLMKELAEVDAELESLASSLLGRAVAAKATTTPKAKASPKTNGKHGPTFTDQVLAQVKGTRTAPSIVASLGLHADKRRAVYKVLNKAAKAKRIRSLGDGKFAPK